MNQLIYPGDFAELHNMKRRHNGLYKLKSIAINRIELKPNFMFHNENNEVVILKMRDFENYIKSVIRTPRPTKIRLC